VSEVSRDEAGWALNTRRAISFVARIAGSLDKEPAPPKITEAELRLLIRVCGSSEFCGEMLASSSSLVRVLARADHSFDLESDFRQLDLRLEQENSLAGRLDVLRRWWSRLFVEIGVRDTQRQSTIAQVNRLLNQLAVASLDASLLIARHELERRYEKLAAEPRIAVLGLGRLGSGGVDYGSDLDVVVVYDSTTDSPVAALTHEAAYGRMTEFLITALSSITREG